MVDNNRCTTFVIEQKHEDLRFALSYFAEGIAKEREAEMYLAKGEEQLAEKLSEDADRLYVLANKALGVHVEASFYGAVEDLAQELLEETGAHYRWITDVVGVSPEHYALMHDDLAPRKQQILTGNRRTPSESSDDLDWQLLP